MADQQRLDSFVIEQIGKQTSFVYISKQIKKNCQLLNRPPIFRPQIGYQGDAIIERIARTSNADEGRHYVIQALFSGSQSGVWKLMASLQKDAAV